MRRARSLIDAWRDVIGLQPTVSERDLPNLVSLARQQPPRIVIRAVLALADHDVVPPARGAELCSHQAGRGGHRRDQGDVGTFGANQIGDRSPGALARGLASGVVQTSLRPVVDVTVIRGLHGAARQSHHGRVEVGSRVCGREQRRAARMSPMRSTSGSFVIRRRHPEPSPIQFAIVKLSDCDRERCPAAFVAVTSMV